MCDCHQRSPPVATAGSRNPTPPLEPRLDLHRGNALILQVDTKSSLPMLPVATTSSRAGEPVSRWLWRKSASLVTTTRASWSVKAARC